METQNGGVMNVQKFEHEAQRYGQPSYAAQMEEPVFRYYLTVLRRRVWVVMTMFVIVVTLGAIHTYKATPIYEGVAKVLVEGSPANPVKSEVETKFSADNTYYEAQKELVKCRAVLEKAIEKPEVQAVFEKFTEVPKTPTSLAKTLGKVKDEFFRTLSAVFGVVPAAMRPLEPWEALRAQVDVELATPFLLIKVADPDRERAARLANGVAAAFEQYSLERRLRSSNEAFLFLQEQRTKQEQELARAEMALQEFREQSEAVSLDVAEKDNPVLTRHKRLSDALTEAQLTRIGLEAQVLVIQEALRSGTEALKSANQELFSIPAVRNDGPVSELRKQLMDVEKEVATLSNTLGPQSPQLQGAKIRQDLIRGKLQESLTQLVGSLSAQLKILSKQETELREQYEQQNKLALDLARQSLKWDHLKSDVDRQRKLFDVLVSRLREVNISSDFAKSNVTVVETALVPNVPVKPNKARMIWMSVFLGVFLGVGVAFFFEYMDDTVTTPDDLQDRVGIPVLGFVPDMQIREFEKDGFLYRGMITLLEPKSSAAEAYRSIRTNISFSAPPEKSKVLVFTSPGPREGKTTTATNLALVLAHSGKRVLLIDADFRRPMVHKAFGLESKMGLTNLLVGEATLEQVLQKVKHNGKILENLDILVAGPRPPNPSELLDSPAMRRILDEGRKKYDRVIIDTPPVLFVADASIVAGASDGVILVIRAAKNTRSVAVKAREHLAGVKAKILGGILNDVYVSRLGYYYSYYYHYYPYARYYRDYYKSYYPEESQDIEQKPGATEKT